MAAFLEDLRVQDMMLYWQDTVEDHFPGVDILHQVHKAAAGESSQWAAQAEGDSLAVGGSHLVAG